MKTTARRPLMQCLPILLWSLLSAPAALADITLPGALVGPQWLLTQLGSDDLVIIDIQEPRLFARHHLPAAINWPFSRWRGSATATPPKSLPPLDQLAARLGALGITAATPIVIIATGTGPGSLSASARVFWTLKVLGHEQVAILDGGLASYINDHRGTYVSGQTNTIEARTPTVYRSQPKLDLLATAGWLQDTAMPLLDARSQAEYVGLISGGQQERPGTLPGAHHLPFDWLTAANGGRLRPVGQLRALFQYAGLGDRPAVHFCHTGNRAALSWFVDYAVLGHHSARLYDGSMMEWSSNPELPMEQKLRLPTSASAKNDR